MIKQIVLKNKVLEIKVGSHLYGLNRPESDEDYSGIFVPPINYFFGLDKVEEVDLSTVSKLENGRNASDAIDRKFYEVRKFVKLALDNNPNIIEQLFVTPENIIYKNWYGDQLLENRFNFLHKGLKNRFIGYAIGQKKNMFVKRNNMFNIEEAINILRKLQPKTYVAENITDLCFFLNDDGKHIFEFPINSIHMKCGDINIQKNITIEKALEQLEIRKSKFSGRKEMVDEYGYDTKFAMHLIRLLLEGKELLETGNLIFPLVDKPLLMKIRNGEYSLAEVSEMADDIENDINTVATETELPDKPQYNTINDMLVKLNQEWFASKGDFK
jgi:predicted nucleotidyltransferase